MFGGVNSQRRVRVSQQQKSEGMIDIGIGQKNPGNWGVPGRIGPRLQGWRCLDLPGEIGRGIDQKPGLRIAAKSQARLGLWPDLPRTCRDAIRACAIPLRQAASRRAPENSDANRLTPELNRARVAGALEENRHAFHCGFDPFLPGILHKKALYR